jgi:hypothetical protein
MKRLNSNQQQLKIFEHSEPELEAWQPVRDDFNFCRLALFVSGDKQADRFRDITHDYEVTSNGRVFTARWEVHHDKQLGLLGPFDRDVWWGILEIVDEVTQGDREKIPEVVFLGSPRAFLKRIGKPYNGKYLLMLNESIRRLLRTVCFSDNAFKCPTTGGYLHKLTNVSLITEAAFKGEVDEVSGVVHETTWIKLGDYVRKNLKSGYITLIDVKYVRLLKSELAKLLYPLLSYRLWLAAERGRDQHIAHWHELRDYLAVNGWDSLARARDRLKPALTELKVKQYIHESSHWSGDFYIFIPGDKFIDELANRLNAKEHYATWVAGKQSVKQLRLLPSVALAPIQSTPEDQRKTVLTQQAIHVGLLHHKPDIELLSRHGWTVEDALSLASTLKP